MSFPRYESYKDSGVEWIGEVPKHWNIARFKWNIERNDGGVWGDDPDGENDTIVLRSTEQTVDGRWQIEEPAQRKLNALEKVSALLKDGDLLVTKSSGSSLHIGKTTLVTPEVAELNCCYSNFMQRIRTKPSLLPKLAWYVMNNNLARLQFDLFSNSTTGLANLNGSLIGQIILPIAPLSEQQTIATFLDRETAKIDALIAEQQWLIELLKEKRQAVISHAVTKGLTPNAPMKDSGIEWLGEVPAHWEVKRLKFIADVQSGVAKGKDNSGHEIIEVPYLRVANVQDGFLDLETIAIIEIPAKDLERYRLRVGDVLMNEGGDYDKLGRGHIWNGEIDPCIHQNHVFAVRPKTVNSEWLNEITGSNYAQFYFMTRSKQSTNLASISSTNIMELPVVLPPTTEQQEILDFISELRTKLDTLITEAQRGIELLKERRAALISAAVTGKIDVRGLVAVQPQIGAAA
jgi:type I restriction enzyme S subunit